MSEVAAVQINNLSKSFDGIEVLRDISLTVNKGEVVSVLGSSGSGKSTLLRCINWLEEPDRGTIHIAGQRIGIDTQGKRMKNRDLAAIRAKTGMVFQSFNLWPHLTVLQNVMEAPIQVKKAARDEARAAAQALLEKVGMEHKADAYPYTLSGGQKQRVAIARALAPAPKVLLCDEPTSALDPELAAEVVEVPAQLAREGTTMLMATHDLRLASTIASNVVFLDAGEIIESGPAAQVFGAPSRERTKRFVSSLTAQAGA